MKGYLAVGHGRTRDGTYDPGAVAGRLVEHELAHFVVDACARALARSGVTGVTVERDAGEAHDPNFSGSAARANYLGVAWAVEVHFNAGGGEGHEVLHEEGGARARRLADRINGGLHAALGTRDRGLKAIGQGERGAGFLWGTSAPSALVEVEFLDGPNAPRVDEVFCARAGEGVARGICIYLGHPFIEEDDMTNEDVQKVAAATAVAVVAALGWGSNPQGGPLPDSDAWLTKIRANNLEELRAAIAGGIDPAVLQDACERAVRKVMADAGQA